MFSVMGTKALMVLADGIIRIKARVAILGLVHDCELLKGKAFPEHQSH